MKRAVKKLWIEALLSGKYKQAKSALRLRATKNNKPGYCCLGVLCDLYAKSHPGARWVRPTGNSRNWQFAVGNGKVMQVAALPEAVQKWAGLEDGLPCVYLKSDYGGLTKTALSSLNDMGFEGKKQSFSDIAAIIKKSF